MVPVSVWIDWLRNKYCGFSRTGIINKDVPAFQTLVPTTENVALVIATRLREGWPAHFTYSSARVSGVSIHETDRNGFEVLLPRSDSREIDSVRAKRKRNSKCQSEMPARAGLNQK